MSPNKNLDEVHHEVTSNASSKKYFYLKNKAVLSGILAFTILAALVTILAYQRFHINSAAQQKETVQIANGVKDKIQESLAQGMAASLTLSFFIEKDGTVEDFDSLASLILAANKKIDALQLLPGGVIRYIYPEKGNENIIGFDLLNDSARKKEAIKAIEKKDFYYAGPFRLIQGGIGIVGRLPIFRNGSFWGFSAVIIKLSTLLTNAGIDSNQISGYEFQLSRINPDTGKEEFFISRLAEPEKDKAYSIYMSNPEWKLSVKPVDSYEGYADVFWICLIGILLAVLGGVFVFIITSKPKKLNELLEQETAALRKNEEQYQNLFNQSSDGVLVYDFDGVIYQFNKAAHTEAGYTEEEFAKLNVADLVIEKKLFIDQQKMEQLLSEGKATFIRTFARKDGAQMEIDVNANLLPDGKILAFIRNITERSVIEKALKEREAKYRSLIEQASDGIVIISTTGIVVEVNNSICRMLGFTEQELLGKQLDKFIPDEDKELTPLRFKELMEGQNLIYERRAQKKDGSIFAVEVNSKMASDNTLIAFIRDITERKNAKLSLEQNEVKYRSLFEQASDGIIITDLSGIVIEVNKSFCEMSGYLTDELIGKPVTDFMPKADVTENPLRINEVLQGLSVRHERNLQKKDGTIINVEVNSRMSIGKTLIGFVRDITERKKAANDLQKSNERFELIARATNDAIWDHDFTNNETVGNENLYSLYGFTPGEDKINFETFLSHIHPDEAQMVIKGMDKAIKEKRFSIAEEFRFKTSDGSYRHFYDRAFVKYDENGTPVRMLGVMQDITRQIKDAQKLLKEKELSDTIINSLPAVFFLFNINGKFLRWNKNVEIISGYSSEEISNLNPMNFVDEGERAQVIEKISNVFESGLDNVEANVVLKNGQKIPYYFSGMMIDYEGEICLMGFGIDFSDKVKAEKLLKESEQKFRSLVEHASDGVTILSATGNPMYVSPSLERILGYTEAEMKAMNVSDLTHPDDAEAIANTYNRVMSNPGVPIKGHNSRIRHKDGSWRWFEDTITNMLHIPSINGIVENLRDVTEKLEIEKRIRTEKELSDSIINSLPGIFYLYDKNGNFIRWNKNFEIVTGYTSEEIRQLHPLNFYKSDLMQTGAGSAEPKFLNQAAGVELQLLTKSGKKVPFYINLMSIDYEGVPCIMGMGIDVTDRKKIEQQLLVSNQRLERKATELKDSFAELERFAYIVSHDLQEPLRMISSFLKLLDQKYKPLLDDKGATYIHFAVDGAERMKQLIMDLLEYSRTGTNKDIAADADMNAVLADVQNVLGSPIREQNAVIEFSQLPVLFNTSRIMMFQLMQNLLGNALKYRGEKNPVIKIDVKEDEKQWQFSVEDNGIDPKFSEKIFVIFQRLHNKEEFSGTGIGLAICKKIVDKLGGKIWVEPAPETGSIFYFTVPKK